MRTSYGVTVAPGKRATVLELPKQGTASARTGARAHIVRHATDGATDEDIAHVLRV